jgi:hypothetical protein
MIVKSNEPPAINLASVDFSLAKAVGFVVIMILRGNYSYCSIKPSPNFLYGSSGNLGAG